MRLKRFISMALCLVVVCLSLVSCEDAIGAYRDKYTWQPEKVANLDYDLYIIVGEGPNGEITQKNATTTVETYVKNYLSEKFNSQLNIEFLTAAEYQAKAIDAVSSANIDRKDYLSDIKNGRVNAGKIVLVAGESMMNDLLATGKLTDLSDFIYNDEYKELFGKIKTQIPEDLMDAAKDENGKIFALPNNHIVGKYKYIVFNREAAQILNYVDTENSELRKMNSLENCDSILLNSYYDKEAKTLYTVNEGIVTKIFENGVEVSEIVSEVPVTAKCVVEEVEADYEYQVECMNNSEYVCNIAEAPVCTSSEAFDSAYAIVAETEVYYFNDTNNNKTADADEIAGAELVASKNEVAKRAMQILNAINSDSYLRNLLQYGVKGINYELARDENGREIAGVVGKHITDDDNGYFMPLHFTGDIFNAYFNFHTDSNAWNKDMYDNGIKQNKKINYYKDIYLKQ